VTQEELGLKADWHPGGTQLRTNLALYYQSYRDIQRTQATVINGGLVTTIVNAATAHVRGVEADITWLPIRALELNAYWAYSDAGYTKWLSRMATAHLPTTATTASPTRQKIPGRQRARELPLTGTAGTLVAGIDGYHQTQIQEQDVNVFPYGIAAAYTIGNLRFEWQNAMDSSLSAAIFVRNSPTRNIIRRVRPSSVWVRPS